MEAYKLGGDTVWDRKHRLAWVTKRGYLALGGDVGVRCRERLNQAPPEPGDNFELPPCLPKGGPIRF
jgi:hypothetical protein